MIENENIPNIDKRSVPNDISVSLASLLKSFSQNSDSAVSAEINIDLEHLERNLLRNKNDNRVDFQCRKSESFLNQLSNIDYSIGDKRSTIIMREEEEADSKVAPRFRLSSAGDSVSSFQMHNLSALKSLLNNQSGQIYLLVKGDSVDTLEGNIANSNLSPGIFDMNSYSHSNNNSNNIHLATDLGDDLSSSESCTTINNSSLMMAAQQLHMSSNISTAELIQKLFESPQSSCTNNHSESLKHSESLLPSLSSNYQRQADNITNYYTCSIDSNNEADVTLLVDDDNLESNSQFGLTNNRSTKNDKQIFLINGNIKMESRQSTTDEMIDNSVKNHFNSLLNDRAECLDLNNDIYNDHLSHNFVQSNIISSFDTTSGSAIASGSNKNTITSKRHKRIKTKPLKNVEANSFAECNSKSYSPNSPMFSMSVSQIEDTSSKESLNGGNGEIKELKRKSSHNEVERRRRDRINTWIGELQNMLPNSEKMQLNRSKSHILKAVYDFFRGQTDQFMDLKEKNEKLEEENREKTAIIKKLETEKEVLLNHLQYINQAVTSTVKSTQESLNRSTVNQYRVNNNNNSPIDKMKISQPYRITNIYTTNSDMANYNTAGYIDNNQNKRRKINNNDNNGDE